MKGRKGEIPTVRDQKTTGRTRSGPSNTTEDGKKVSSSQDIPHREGPKKFESIEPFESNYIRLTILCESGSVVEIS